MLCGQCGEPFEAGARFCPACGAPTDEASCAQCGARLAPTARFCPACGTTVADRARAVEQASGGGESARQRKVATLLFADLVGFTNLNEAHDPEVIEAVVSRTFDRLSAEVVRYEGVVEKFAGDAMLAVFGVPTVHEDDAERAVRAALDMQQAMTDLRAQFAAEGRPGLGLRIGIETGDVLADQRRAANERDRMVTGDAVNTAARLEQAAAPGAVVVGPGTYAATPQTIEYEELEPISLKGKAAPIPAWRAVRVPARRGGVRPVLGIEAPLIGRDEELGLLKETVRRTAAEGKPHLVTVLASAGVGKSRLTWELEQYLGGLPDLYHWRKGRCLAYAQTSYSALGDVMAADASVLDDDPPATVAEKLATRLADLAPSGAPDAVEAAARVVIGLPSDAGTSRDELFEAWRTYLELVAHRAPLLLVLEDIHWADEGLLDFIEFLARWAEAPIVILCLARHELLERRPSWGGGLPNATSIVLEPLGPGESEQMVDALLGGSLLAALRQRVVEVSEGNPLFTEELVRLFVDRGVVRQTDGRWQQAQPIEQVEIPQSIQALLAARLDSLPADEKRISQDAAVVGRIFWDRLLVHLTGQSPAAVVASLRRLRVKELIVAREPSTLTDAAEYAFRHVLIRDVAYESLPKLDRARKHRAVAEWAEDRLADRAQEVVELLAAHYWSALRYQEEFSGEGPALDELRRKTLEYAGSAGRRASEVGQLESATHWMRIVVEQSRKLGGSPTEHAARVVEYLDLGWAFEHYEVKGARIDEALAMLGAMPERAELDRKLEASLRQRQAHAHYESSGDAAGTRASIQAGLQALDGLGPCAERAALLHRLGWLAWRAGPAADASAPLEAALNEARAAGSARLERWALHDLGHARRWTGSKPEGNRLLERSMELAQEANDRELLLRCYVNIGLVLTETGDFRQAIPMWEEGLQRARRSMDRSSTLWLGVNLADALTEMGRLEEALLLHDEVIVAVGAMGLGHFDLVSRCWTLLQMGRLNEARATWEEVRSDEIEPQHHSRWASLPAALGWADDPEAGVAAMRVAAEYDYRTTALLARMALRTGHDDALRFAADSLHELAGDAGDSPAAMHARWASALLGPDRAAAARSVAEIAAEFEAVEHRLPAADAYADAAWLGQRAGIAVDDWVGRAAALYAACSAVPLLEALPVTVAGL
jgi:class 3 adenylate cyclase/tetratricopeptide (TPR) repeat protein